MTDGVAVAFLGALQASVSVLLTIFYGVIGAQFNLLSVDAARRVSTICVKLFLPALLLTNIGNQLSIESGARYLPILVWALVYNIVSIALGLMLQRVFKLPNWVVPAVTFNNTTAMPLLLIQSLGATGLLENLLTAKDDTVDVALQRAKSYFLVNSMVADSFTFGIGPRLLGGPHEEDSSDAKRGTSSEQHDPTQEEVEEAENSELEEAIEQNEESSLLPNRLVDAQTRASFSAHALGKRFWKRLPGWLQTVLGEMQSFVSAPLIGTLIGAVLGIVPALHRVFFNDTEEGGIFKAWLTTSVQNMGDLFPTLQVIVVGVKLCQSLKAMKKGEDSGRVPWTPFLFVTFVRYILWPAISIPVVWALATRAGVLSSDPMLWFAMMLMPTGPPALKLQALADVTGVSEQEKMSLAKFLTISYIVSPLMSFAVVGALRASEAAIRAS